MKRHPFEIAPALKDAFLFSVMIAHKVLLNRGNNLALGTWGLDLRCMWVLMAVSDRRLNQKDLSHAFCTRPDVMGNLIDKLERGHYVKRVVSENDRRMKFVEITRKGAAILKNRDTLRDEMIAKLLDPLPASIGLSMQMFANKIIDSSVEGQTK